MIRIVLGLLALMGLAEQASAAPVTLADPAQEKAVVAACRSWMKPLDVNADATFTAVSGGLCLNGQIGEGSDARFLAVLKTVDPATPLVVVVRSGGGEVNAALTIGEALLQRPVTVVADKVCASSCANYLITAGRRKVVMPDTLLLYHGGARLEALNDMAPQIEALAKQDSRLHFNDVMEQNREQLNAQVARQEAFLVKAGISPILFRWMDLVNHMIPTEAAKHCALDSEIVAYSPQTLRGFGLTFDAYHGPRSQSDVDALLRRDGKTSKVCY